MRRIAELALDSDHGVGELARREQIGSCTEMQGRPPPRPTRPQEPRDFDPRLVDAPHSNHQQPPPAARLQPDHRRPSHDDPRARHNDQRAAGQGQGQGSRDRRSRHGDGDDDVASYGAQDDVWATSEEDSECREPACATRDSTDSVHSCSAPTLRLVVPQSGTSSAVPFARTVRVTPS